MQLSITLFWLLPFAACMAAPASNTQDSAVPDPALFQALFNQAALAGAAPDQDNTMASPVTLPSGQTFQNVNQLKDALTNSVKSQLMTSMAAMSPEMAGMFPTGMTSTAAAGTDQLSQLNLSNGINNLVKLVVQKILEALLPSIFGQATPTNPATPTAPAPAPATPTNPMGGLFGGMLGGGMGSSNPFGMMLPSMLFGFMDNFF